METAASSDVAISSLNGSTLISRTISSKAINVLVADSHQLECQLLVRALRRRAEFRVTSCSIEPEDLLKTAISCGADVAVMNTEHPRDARYDMSIMRRFHLAQPGVAKVLLLEAYDRETVLGAFRSGAKGIFCFADYPFRLLCKCIHSVHRGQVWANSEQLQYLVEGITQVPSLRVVNVNGEKLLTPREEQVVALVADGLGNREVAVELNLSEHTIKKYLFRIFDKLGISSRVELVLYAVNHSAWCQAEWLQGQAVARNS